MRTARAVAAGMVGTAAMTALLLIEPSVGLPKIAMGQVVSTSLGLASASLTIGPVIGWVLHFLVGIVLAVVYAAFLSSRLPGSTLVRGLLYGTLIFLVAQIVFIPLAGMGLFSRGEPELLVGSLLGHLVYGGLTSWIYGHATVPG
jgi:uncharacterized membrane protein YagU involved in acid resistance